MNSYGTSSMCQASIKVSCGGIRRGKVVVGGGGEGLAVNVGNTPVTAQPRGDDGAEPWWRSEGRGGVGRHLVARAVLQPDAVARLAERAARAVEVRIQRVGPHVGEGRQQQRAHAALRLAHHQLPRLLWESGFGRQAPGGRSTNGKHGPADPQLEVLRKGGGLSVVGWRNKGAVAG